MGPTSYIRIIFKDGTYKFYGDAFDINIDNNRRLMSFKYYDSRFKVNYSVFYFFDNISGYEHGKA